MPFRSVVLINSSHHQILVTLPLLLMLLNSSNSHLVKAFNVSKPACSGNASDPVICNSTCRPVSKFVSDWLSVKPVRISIDVNRKRHRE